MPAMLEPFSISAFASEHATAIPNSQARCLHAVYEVCQALLTTEQEDRTPDLQPHIVISLQRYVIRFPGW
jgi:hypothetical protein